jgi:potassium-dependent mechanosensitive channel
MNWLSSHSIEIAGARISLASLLVAIAILLIGFFLATKLSERVRGGVSGSPAGLRWRGTLAQVTGHSIRAATLAFALQVAGVDIGTVLAAGAVVAVGIGIAMQKVAENFVSGVILMAERSIREGDIIEFEQRIARIVHIGIRATIAQTLDDEEIIVPNSVLAQSTVKNLTLTEPICRLRVQVGVSYSSDLGVVESVLAGAADAIAWRAKERAPVVLLLGFGASSVDFEVSVWTKDVWGIRRGQSELRKAVWGALKGAAITIPFPQLDIHTDAPLPASTGERAPRAADARVSEEGPPAAP